jgi:hypothetical protein
MLNSKSLKGFVLLTSLSFSVLVPSVSTANTNEFKEVAHFLAYCGASNTFVGKSSGSDYAASIFEEQSSDYILASSYLYLQAGLTQEKALQKTEENYIYKTKILLAMSDVIGQSVDVSQQTDLTNKFVEMLSNELKKCKELDESVSSVLAQIEVN